MRRIVLAAVLLLCVAGCSSAPDDQGYKKEDFSSRPRPAGYGPPTGNHASPPPSATGG